MRGFYTVLVPECAAAPTPALEASAHEDFSDHIGAIVPLADSAVGGEINRTWLRTST